MEAPPIRDIGHDRTVTVDIGYVTVDPLNSIQYSSQLYQRIFMGLFDCYT